MENEYISPHEAHHKSHRAPWLRAAVLGVNDGIVSTSSLMLGVLGASGDKAAFLTAGIAGLVAGAISMGVGEYVSVSSQKDSEKADIEIERKSIAENPEEELNELAEIYVRRGVQPDLAFAVATQLHAHDAVGAHARDELDINQDVLANPMQAALASTVAFSIGATVPLIAALLSNADDGVYFIVAASIVGLGVSGSIGAYLGGGHKLKAAIRVLVGGTLAMGVTYVIGTLIGYTL
jgi:VIT1/CCC1 family predicted Fe2+/Mn2+ transporter